MESLLIALQEKFNASTALKTRFTDGLYHALGPNEQPMPVVSVKVTNSDNQYETGRDYEAIFRVHFDLWAATDTEALQALSELEAAFDFGALNFNGFLQCEKVGFDLFKEDEAVWRGILDYDVFVDRTY